MSVNVSVNSAMGSVVSSEEPPKIDTESNATSTTYHFNDPVTLTANSKPGYRFVRWEENGQTVSTQQAYSFLAEATRNLTAVFEPFRLGFPLKDRVPYIAEGETAVTVTAVMDHSLQGGYYTADGRNQEVMAYNGLVANGIERYYDGVYCYDVEGVVPFPGILYSGVFPSQNRSEICYDEHPGYDFSGLIQGYNETQTDPEDGQLGNGHDILATQNGKLYKDATGEIYSNGWDSYHAFYIDHGNGYYSWYLHSGRLNATVESQIQTQGYATVTKGQHIAEVAGYGPYGLNDFPDHLHFEVRKDGFGHANVIDPYGVDMWEQSAP
jgi:murein DD-endopeptidase MepM/ murein hydrolase activator NlpD